MRRRIFFFFCFSFEGASFFPHFFILFLPHRFYSHFFFFFYFSLLTFLEQEIQVVSHVTLFARYLTEEMIANAAGKSVVWKILRYRESIRVGSMSSQDRNLACVSLSLSLALSYSPSILETCTSSSTWWTRRRWQPQSFANLHRRTFLVRIDINVRTIERTIEKCLNLKTIDKMWRNIFFPLANILHHFVESRSSFSKSKTKKKRIK